MWRQRCWRSFECKREGKRARRQEFDGPDCWSASCCCARHFWERWRIRNRATRWNAIPPLLCWRLHCSRVGTAALGCPEGKLRTLPTPFDFVRLASRKIEIHVVPDSRGRLSLRNSSASTSQHLCLLCPRSFDLFLR